MQFSDTTNKQGLIEDIGGLLGGTVDTNSYTLADRTRAINENYRTVWSWIFEAYGGWQFDDSNQSDLPQSTATLTADVSKYAIPTDAISVKAVNVKDGGGVWRALIPLTLEMIQQGEAVDEFLNTSSIPMYYRLVGSTIELKPAPSYTQSASLKVFFDRDIVTFASTATTATPGFPAPFHRVLSIGAALDFAEANDLISKIETLSRKWADYERRIKGYYLQRYRDMFPTKIKVRDRLREYM